MGCVVSSHDATTTLAVSGRFVFDMHRDFRNGYEQAIGRPQTSLVQVDLSGVEYLDSSALGMLLLMKERVLSAGKRVSLKGPSPLVRRILETANFHKLFEIV